MRFEDLIMKLRIEEEHWAFNKKLGRFSIDSKANLVEKKPSVRKKRKGNTLVNVILEGKVSLKKFKEKCCV